MMYGKFFQSTFTGSMYGAGAEMFAVWGYVIANAADGTIELNPNLLSAVIGMPSERVTDCIEQLCAPDEASRSDAEEGRRLIREGQYQYRVVNHAQYRQVRNEEERRAYNREKQREHRAKAKEMSNGMSKTSMTVNDSQSLSAMSAHTEAEAETDKEKIGNQSQQQDPQTQPPPARQPNGCPPCPHEAIKNLYNEILTELPPIRLWTEARRKMLHQRWRKKEFQSIEFWRRYFEHVRGVPFLHGKNDRHWQANIDFLLKETSIVKIMEGQYETG